MSMKVMVACSGWVTVMVVIEVGVMVDFIFWLIKNWYYYMLCDSGSKVDKQ